MHEERAEVRNLGVVLGVMLAILALEVAGGLISGSLALLADAAHMATDAASAALALWAAWLAGRPRDMRHTFGYGRSKVLAALANGSALFAIVALVAIEGVRHLGEPQAVNERTMLVVASVALVANLALSWSLARSHGHSLNVRAVVAHAMGDALASFGVIVAGVVILLTGWLRADAVVSLFIAVLVAFSAWSVVRDSVTVLMEGAPREFDVDALRRTLDALPYVSDVHDLHVWSVGSQNIAASFHVRVPQTALASSPETVTQLKELLNARFHVSHATIEVESETCAEACD
ncbi:MAG TPA: cation diffusion facilitator family transporter [Candidatus Dormibacteraeota bacterium]|nr:cation diffusion facilitator family transporter [Candidatus Dormibacteraeota bacterium]